MSNYYTKTNIDTNIYTKTQSDTNYYSKATSDGRYYLATTTLNSITAPTGSLSLNSQKIINLLDPTSN